MALVWAVPSAKTEPLTSAPLPQRALKPAIFELPLQTQYNVELAAQEEGIPTFSDTSEKTGRTFAHTKELHRDSEITTPFRIRAANPVPHARLCLGAIQAHHLIGIDRPVAWLLTM